jgi:hypothetical protein
VAEGLTAEEADELGAGASEELAVASEETAEEEG